MSNDKEAGKPAAPSVEQDERGAFEAWAGRYTRFPENYDNIPAWLAWQARAASPAANVAQEEVAWFYYEDGEFIRMYDSEEEARIAVEKFGGDYEPVYRRRDTK